MYSNLCLVSSLLAEESVPNRVGVFAVDEQVHLSRSAMASATSFTASTEMPCFSASSSVAIGDPPQKRLARNEPL